MRLSAVTQALWAPVAPGVKPGRPARRRRAGGTRSGAPAPARAIDDDLVAVAPQRERGERVADARARGARARGGLGDGAVGRADEPAAGLAEELVWPEGERRAPVRAA